MSDAAPRKAETARWRDEIIPAVLAVAFGLLFPVAMAAAAYSSISGAGRTQSALVTGTGADGKPTSAAPSPPDPNALFPATPSPLTSACIPSAAVSPQKCGEPQCVTGTPPPGWTSACLSPVPLSSPLGPVYPSPICAGACGAPGDDCTASEVDAHMWTDQKSYAPGQPVWIWSYAHNHSARICIVPFNSCSDGITISEDDIELVVFPANPPPGQPCYLKGSRLAPGESTGTSGTRWEQQRACRIPPGSAQPCPAPKAPPGSYTVHANIVVSLTAAFTLTAT